MGQSQKNEPLLQQPHKKMSHFIMDRDKKMSPSTPRFSARILGRDPAVASFFAGYSTFSATYRISRLFAMAQAMPRDRGRTRATFDGLAWLATP